jgi:hypothetical protein
VEFVRVVVSLLNWGYCTAVVLGLEPLMREMSA